MADDRIVYLTWKSPSRLFKKRDKEFFRNVAAIVFLLLLILFFAKEFALILAVVAITFVIYVFSTVPPEEIVHTVTSDGIETGGRDYAWDELKAFWFEEQWGHKMVTVVLEKGPRLMILLGDMDHDQVKDVFNRFLKFYEVPQKTMVDSAATWLSKKIPLDTSS